MMTRKSISFTAAMVALVVSAPANAQSVADFYKGTRITIVVGTPPGGGYDLNARTLARHLGRHVPGNPAFMVQNMPGANSMNAANHVYNVAPRDGTVIGAASRTMAYAPLFDIKGARYDVSKLSWLGSTAKETGVVLAWHTASVKTAEDVFKNELIVGATDPNSDLYLFPYILNNLLGTKFKIVSGYASLPPIGLALERGEVQGVGNYTWTTLIASHGDWLRDKKVVLLMQLAVAKHPDLPNVPLVMDFAKTDEQRQILTVFMGMKTFGFPFFVGPDVPANRLRALQAAFNATMNDPDFQAEQKQQSRETSPSSAQDIHKVLGEAYALPPGMVEKLRALMPK